MLSSSLNKARGIAAVWERQQEQQNQLQDEEQQQQQAAAPRRVTKLKRRKAYYRHKKDVSRVDTHNQFEMPLHFSNCKLTSLHIIVRQLPLASSYCINLFSLKSQLAMRSQVLCELFSPPEAPNCSQWIKNVSSWRSLRRSLFLGKSSREGITFIIFLGGCAFLWFDCCQMYCTQTSVYESEEGWGTCCQRR